VKYQEICRVSGSVQQVTEMEKVTIGFDVMNFQTIYGESETDELSASLSHLV